MAIQTSGGNGVSANINVTPMIDILLVLLIVFMAISPVHPRGLEAAIPREGDSSPAVQERQIVVELAKDGAVRVNGEDTGWERLGSRLAEIFKVRRDKTIFVAADRGLEFQAVARAIDTAYGVGANQVGFMSRR